MSLTSRKLPYAIAAVVALCTGAVAGGQTSAPTGSVVGVVTAGGANAQTIKAAHVLVQMWRADATSNAVRDSACNAWLADKVVWLQANEELESPSGMNLTGTQLGRDVEILHSLYALRRDTVRSADDGTYTFTDVPPGAYTVTADTYAGDKFLQWNADVGVLPKFTTHADLGAGIVAENQYCTLANAGPAPAEIYETKDLDRPITPIGPPDPSGNDFPVIRDGSVAIAFVVDELGIPDLQTVTIKRSTIPLSLADARNIVAKLRFTVPTVHGRPVKVRSGLGIGIRSVMERRAH
ncbi:MAG TPA: carboxypeptidase-like regulatory domain-containing protein [Gemmatimonadaceae bacterium]|nr:carboxypeptidase-like regulatory domain-containing protein [Gemmatimonadaceae bacterium]